MIIQLFLEDFEHVKYGVGLVGNKSRGEPGSALYNTKSCACIKLKKFRCIDYKCMPPKFQNDPFLPLLKKSTRK